MKGLDDIEFRLLAIEVADSALGVSTTIPGQEAAHAASRLAQRGCLSVEDHPFIPDFRRGTITERGRLAYRLHLATLGASKLSKGA